jgi:hypothetical protein
MAAVRPITKRSGHVLIIWGDGFDEAVAAVFTTELRRAGLPVKVVGLMGRQATGVHGLLLGADLTLSDALPIAHQAIGVILPCTAATMRRIDNDPRVYDLLQQACANDAMLMIQHTSVLSESRIKHLVTSEHSVSLYGDTDNLTAYARNLAAALLNQSG